MRKLMLFALLAGLMLVPSMVAADKPDALAEGEVSKQASVVTWIGGWQEYLVEAIGGIKKKIKDADAKNDAEIKAIYDALAASYTEIDTAVKAEATA